MQGMGIMINIVGQVLLPHCRSGSYSDQGKRGWGAKALLLLEEVYESLVG